jgi:hypothetical protein
LENGKLVHASSFLELLEIELPESLHFSSPASTIVPGCSSGHDASNGAGRGAESEAENSRPVKIEESCDQRQDEQNFELCSIFAMELKILSKTLQNVLATEQPMASE